MNICEIYEFLSGYFFPMLPFLIPARYLRKLERFLARVIGKAIAKWLKKFMEAFLTAAIGDPKEVGARSECGCALGAAVMVMMFRVREGYKHRAARKKFFGWGGFISHPTGVLIMSALHTPRTNRGP